MSDFSNRCRQCGVPTAEDVCQDHASSAAPKSTEIDSVPQGSALHPLEVPASYLLHCVVLNLYFCDFLTNALIQGIHGLL